MEEKEPQLQGMAEWGSEHRDGKSPSRAMSWEEDGRPWTACTQAQSGRVQLLARKAGLGHTSGWNPTEQIGGLFS